MIKKIGIHLKVKDIRKSLAFYQLFKLPAVFAYGDPGFLALLPGVPNAPEKYCGVTFEVGGGLFEIGGGHLAVKPEVFQQTVASSKVSAMLQVDSVEEVQQICEANDIEIAVPIRKFPWGTTEIVVKDPDGFVLVFIEKYY